jgi:hypothetical protein
VNINTAIKEDLDKLLERGPGSDGSSRPPAVGPSRWGERKKRRFASGKEARAGASLVILLLLVLIRRAIPRQIRVCASLSL